MLGLAARSTPWSWTRAIRMRPTTLDTFLGQEHLIGSGKPLRVNSRLGKPTVANATKGGGEVGEGIGNGIGEWKVEIGI